MIIRKNGSKILTKAISCKCKCRFDGKKCNSYHGGIMINVYVNVKNVMDVKKIISGILLLVLAKMGNI